MLRELEPLRLIIGAEVEAVKPLRAVQHVFVDETADDLAMLQNERHLVTADFEHRPAAAAAGRRMAEPGVKETGIMNAELAHQRIERRHLGGIEWRYMNGLAGNEDVEFVRVEDEVIAAAAVEGLPEIENRMLGFLVDVDDRCVMLAAIADQPVGAGALEVDGKGDPAAGDVWRSLATSTSLS